MHAVRRTAALAGLAGCLLLAPATAAFAEDEPDTSTVVLEPSPPGTTFDCGQTVEDGGPPASEPPQEVVCIAGGLRPDGLPPEAVQSGPVADGAGAAELPRTGSDQVVPFAALGGSALLAGVVACLAGRRRRIDA